MLIKQIALKSSVTFLLSINGTFESSAVVSRVSALEKVSPPGSGGYPLIWAICVFAAPKGTIL